MRLEIDSPLDRARQAPIRGIRAVVVILITALVAGMLTALVAERAVAATAKTLVISASETAVVSARKPTTVLKSSLSATSSQDRTYLRYTLPADFDSAGVVTAKLSLKVGYSTATKSGVQVFPEKGAWKGSSVTYATRPAESGSRLNATAPTARTGARLSIDLGDISTAVKNGAVSLRVSYLQKYVSSTYLRSGADAPRLTLTYKAKTATPPTPSVTPVPTPKPTSTAAPAPAPSYDKKVFAHYFPPYPISIDNQPAATDYYARNYLTVGGEGGKHASYGGMLRDRPIGVAPSTSSNWKVENLRREVRQAKQAGIDGFTVNIMSLSGMNWDATVNLMRAAEMEGGFVVVPMIDATASAGRASSNEVADKLASLYTSSAAYRTKAQYLLSSFRAEGQSVSWWTQIINRLETTHKIPITFQAVFLSASESNMKAFSGIADGFGNWGVRSEWHTTNAPNYVAQAAKYGKTWMAPVSIQDYRPEPAVYAESSNTGNLRASWESAIEKGAQFVQIVTWNDYSESTQFAPSVGHGDTFLDISKRFVDWFHTGKQPGISSDQAFVTHRTQLVNATPILDQILAKPTLGGTLTTPTDNVEALVYLTAPATVTVTVGSTTRSFSAPAGESVFTVPVKVGAVSVNVTRGSQTVAQVTSPYRIVGSPSVQDLTYHGATSIK